MHPEELEALGGDVDNGPYVVPTPYNAGDGMTSIAGFDEETADGVSRALDRGYVDPVDYDD